MSVSLYRWTEECEQDSECVGDCDLCRKETMVDRYDEVGIPTMEVEADGFITRPEALERMNANKAKPETECAYPNCEECDKYHGHYCTVPIVFSKQMFKDFNGIMERTRMQIESLMFEIAVLKERAYPADEQMTWTEVDPPMMAVGKEDR